ncbi:hypothetical protein [Enterobacter chuandaensis]|uniref:hypothetical protein n=1 Tax=Enterobacter chuandaensis TaxID=2497875 RepID=UPI00300DB835
MIILRYCSSRDAVCLERKRGFTVHSVLIWGKSLVGLLISGACFVLAGYYAHVGFIFPDQTVQTEQGYSLSAEHFIYKKRALPTVEERPEDEESLPPVMTEETSDNSDLKARVQQAMAEIDP